jgi:hypothetical protein
MIDILKWILAIWLLVPPFGQLVIVFCLAVLYGTWNDQVERKRIIDDNEL